MRIRNPKGHNNASFQFLVKQGTFTIIVFPNYRAQQLLYIYCTVVFLSYELNLNTKQQNSKTSNKNVCLLDATHNKGCHLLIYSYNVRCLPDHSYIKATFVGSIV